MLTEKLKKLLNPEQYDAVTTIDGPLLVLAGAGTGKTRVITHRIAYMIECGIPPENIAGMTFTNKAANEMRERISALIPHENAKKVYLGTFHSFCARFLRKEIGILNFTNSFTIADESDQSAMVTQAMLDCNVPEKYDRNLFISKISRAKGALIDPNYLESINKQPLGEMLKRVYERYMKILENHNMLDFDDLLCFTVKILQNNTGTLKKYQNIYKYLLVDEYQDTNMSQFRIIELLSGERKNLCVVGDDDQSIYGWRGAEVKNILEFPEHFSGCKIVSLEQNYRSTKIILDVANSIISKNDKRHNKKLWSKLAHGEKIIIYEARDDEQEASFISDKIVEIRIKNPDATFSSFAILYRSNYQSRKIEDLLRNKRIPYCIIGSKSFYERREVRDVIAYLKLVANPKDGQSFLRIINVPARGIGDKSIQELKEVNKKNNKSFLEIAGTQEFLESIGKKASEGLKSFHETLDKWRKAFHTRGELYQKAATFINEVGYIEGLKKIYKNTDDAQKRIENVEELLNMIAEFEINPEEHEPTIIGFLEKFSLQDDRDKIEEHSDNKKKNTVTLMTVHTAKGLEYDYVFVAGMENNLFPHERSLKEGTIDEERRLFYVAVTRAKKNLFLSHSQNRMKYGKYIDQNPSSFLRDIPEKLSKKQGIPKSNIPKPKSNLKFEDYGFNQTREEISQYRFRHGKIIRPTTKFDF